MSNQMGSSSIKPTALIESLLLAAARPLKMSELSKLLQCEADEIDRALDSLAGRYEAQESGIILMRHGGSVQLGTHPDAGPLVRQFLDDETSGELTRPSIETLTIIAYRGPIRKEEIEQIRGVNCSLILRNLAIRGLVETVSHQGELRYQVTLEFLRSLGVAKVDELPDYAALNTDPLIDTLLAQQLGESPS